MAWVYLVVAGVFEVVWAVLMKRSSGFTKFGPTVGTVAFMVASFLLLSRAMKVLPLGVSYAVWVGIGAVGSVLAGVWLLGERLSPAQIAFLTLIGVGIVGLQVTTRT
ncbi:MAG: transporter [Phycisphaerae bacterium]|nr:MAG: transporter [Phycisphaerae bacterium]